MTLKHLPVSAKLPVLMNEVKTFPLDEHSYTDLEDGQEADGILTLPVNGVRVLKRIRSV